MALKIRFRQQGRNNRPFYRLVLTDGRSKRDGKYQENLGWYNPFAQEGQDDVHLKGERINYWLSVGAEISERAWALVEKVAPEVTKEHQGRMQVKKDRLVEKARARRKSVAV